MRTLIDERSYSEIRALVKFVWILLVGGAGGLLLIGFWGALVLRSRYWGNLTLQLVEYASLALLLIALLVLPAWFLVADHFRRRRGWLKVAANCGVLLLGLVTVISSGLMLDGIVYDLSHGPQLGHGAIESLTGGSGKWPVGYMVVQESKYTVIDSQWFHTLSVGQQVDFVYGPRLHFAYPSP